MPDASRQTNGWGGGGECQNIQVNLQVEGPGQTNLHGRDIWIYSLGTTGSNSSKMDNTHLAQMW